MRTRRLWLTLCLFALATSAASGAFRAAVATADITPDTPQWLLGYQARQSTGVHDHIHHRVVALDIFLAAAVALCVAASLGTGRTVFLDVAIGLALVGFVGTVGWARLIERSAGGAVQEPRS